MCRGGARVALVHRCLPLASAGPCPVYFNPFSRRLDFWEAIQRLAERGQAVWATALSLLGALSASPRLMAAASASRSICLCVAPSLPPPAPVLDLAGVPDYSRKWSALFLPLVLAQGRLCTGRLLSDVATATTAASRVRRLRQLRRRSTQHRCFPIYTHLSGSVDSDVNLQAFESRCERQLLFKPLSRGSDPSANQNKVKRRPELSAPPPRGGSPRSNGSVFVSSKRVS